jgi:hypothetical protein
MPLILINYNNIFPFTCEFRGMAVSYRVGMSCSTQWSFLTVPTSPQPLQGRQELIAALRSAQEPE